MKSIVNKAVVFAVSAVVLGTAAWAQSSVTTVMWAKIPFAFQTARGTMPAGEYKVVEGFNGVPGMLALESGATRKTVVTIGTLADWKDSGTTSIVFRCDDDCVLTAVKTRSHTVAYGGDRASHGREIAILATSRARVSGE